MPVTLKHMKAYVKDTTSGDYVGFDTVSDGTTAERVEAIEDAGADMLDAIDEKGQQTLDSIPSDYTALVNKVNGMISVSGTKLILTVD